MLETKNSLIRTPLKLLLRRVSPQQSQLFGLAGVCNESWDMLGHEGSICWFLHTTVESLAAFEEANRLGQPSAHRFDQTTNRPFRCDQ